MKKEESNSHPSLELDEKGADVISKQILDVYNSGYVDREDAADKPEALHTDKS